MNNVSNLKNNILLLKRTFQTTWESNPRLLIISIILKITPSVAPFFQLYITANLINNITKSLITDQRIVLYSTMLFLFYQIALSSSLILIRGIDSIVAEKINEKLKYTIQKKLNLKISNLPLNHFENADYYNAISRASIGIQGTNIFERSTAIFQIFFSLISYILIINKFSILLFITLFLTTIPVIVFNLKFSKSKYRSMHIQTENGRKESYFNNLLKNKEIIKEIRVYKTLLFLMKKWEKHFYYTSNERYRLLRKITKTDSLLETVQIIVINSLTLLIIWLGRLKGISIGEYIALTQALTAAQQSMSLFGKNISNIYETALFSSNYYSFMDLKEIKKNKSCPNIIKYIEVNNLSFKYDSKLEYAINDVSFSVTRGEKIAIVGENGSGKSTLIKCLLGFYPVGCGTIKYNNVDINEITESSLMDNISAVFQDYGRYNLSLRENLIFGNNEDIRDKEIKKISLKTNLNTLIDQLPKKLDTEVGVMFGNGVDLSYGQWQKLVVTRSLLKKSQIIVLDEPSASLDPIAEAKLFEQFSILSEKRTTFLVSHRLGICRSADKILVMKSGKLVEMGTHDELINKEGYYYEMYSIQSSLYK